MRLGRAPKPPTREQMAREDAQRTGRHSIEYLCHDTREENIDARLAIGRRIEWELKHHEAFHRAGRDPWTEVAVGGLHRTPVTTFFDQIPVEVDDTLPPNVVRFIDRKGGMVLAEIKVTP